MAINKCRICHRELFKGPLLRYKNMPKFAQFLPDAQSLKSDRGVDLEVYQCSGCGLVQLNSQPVTYYREVIRAAGVSEEMRRFRIKQFSGFVKKFSLEKKKIIEIGCGSGEYLSIMKQAGADAYGLEYSKELVKKCVESGLRVAQGFIRSANCKLRYAPFDAFFMLNFLEHLPDPNSALRGMYNNLTDEGVGIVEVPNLDMILRNKLFSEFMRDHLLYFTRESLSLALSLNGFEVIDCRQVWHEYIISAVVSKRKKSDVSGFYKHQMQIKQEIESYIRKFKDKKVAIWGAGHQALALISLMGLSGKIEYVVDSAEFKQGKYTPATHIPIVSPEMLKRAPVEAVMIMAASYSEEVARLIKKKFNKKIQVSILRDYGLEQVV